MLFVLVEARPQDVDLGLLDRARPAVLQLVNVVDLFAYNDNLMFFKVILIEKRLIDNFHLGVEKAIELVTCQANNICIQ